MSPVLFALALDPFLTLLSHSCPEDTMIRAYADDMAIVLQNINMLPRVIECFRTLEKASSLTVNVSKTICVPLDDGTVEQCRAKISTFSWGSGMASIWGSWLALELTRRLISVQPLINSDPEPYIGLDRTGSETSSKVLGSTCLQRACWASLASCICCRRLGCKRQQGCHSSLRMAHTIGCMVGQEKRFLVQS